MDGDSLKRSMEIVGLSQVRLAEATGLSEAAISRQLSGDLRLSDHVRRTALRLVRRRAVAIGKRILRHYGSSTADIEEGEG